MDIFQIVRRDRDDEFFRAIDRVDINILNQVGQNLLHEAVLASKTKVGLELIRRGINVNHQDSQGQSPLHHAALKRNVELVEAILKAGGNLLAKDSYGNGPLWTAVFNAKGNYDIVKPLVEYGADPRSKNKAGRSPLDFAKKINDASLIALLEKPVERTAV